MRTDVPTHAATRGYGAPQAIHVETVNGLMNEGTHLFYLFPDYDWAAHHEQATGNSLRYVTSGSRHQEWSREGLGRVNRRTETFATDVHNTVARGLRGNAPVREPGGNADGYMN